MHKDNSRIFVHLRDFLSILKKNAASVKDSNSENESDNSIYKALGNQKRCREDQDSDSDCYADIVAKKRKLNTCSITGVENVGEVDQSAASDYTINNYTMCNEDNSGQSVKEIKSNVNGFDGNNVRKCGSDEQKNEEPHNNVIEIFDSQKSKDENCFEKKSQLGNLEECSYTGLSNKPDLEKESVQSVYSPSLFDNDESADSVTDNDKVEHSGEMADVETDDNSLIVGWEGGYAPVADSESQEHFVNHSNTEYVDDEILIAVPCSHSDEDDYFDNDNKLSSDNECDANGEHYEVDKSIQLDSQCDLAQNEQSSENTNDCKHKLKCLNLAKGHLSSTGGCPKSSSISLKCGEDFEKNNSSIEIVDIDNDLNENENIADIDNNLNENENIACNSKRKNIKENDDSAESIQVLSSDTENDTAENKVHVLDFSHEIPSERESIPAVFKVKNENVQVEVNKTEKVMLTLETLDKPNSVDGKHASSVIPVPLKLNPAQEQKSGETSEDAFELYSSDSGRRDNNQQVLNAKKKLNFKYSSSDDEDPEYEKKAKKFREKCKKKYVRSVGRKNNKDKARHLETTKSCTVEKYSYNSKKSEKLSSVSCKAKNDSEHFRLKPHKHFEKKSPNKSPKKSPIIIMTDSETGSDVEQFREKHRRKVDRKLKEKFNVTNDPVIIVEKIPVKEDSMEVVENTNNGFAGISVKSELESHSDNRSEHCIGLTGTTTGSETTRAVLDKLKKRAKLITLEFNDKSENKKRKEPDSGNAFSDLKNNSSNRSHELDRCTDNKEKEMHTFINQGSGNNHELILNNTHELNKHSDMKEMESQGKGTFIYQGDIINNESTSKNKTDTGISGDQQGPSTSTVPQETRNSEESDSKQKKGSARQIRKLEALLQVIHCLIIHVTNFDDIFIITKQHFFLRNKNILQWGYVQEEK